LRGIQIEEEEDIPIPFWRKEIEGFLPFTIMIER
jgi:hypothetical protein